MFSLPWSCCFCQKSQESCLNNFIAAQIYGFIDQCLKFTRSVSSGGSKFISMPLGVCGDLCVLVTDKVRTFRPILEPQRCVWGLGLCLKVKVRLQSLAWWILFILSPTSTDICVFISPSFILLISDFLQNPGVTCGMFALAHVRVYYHYLCTCNHSEEIVLFLWTLGWE